MTIKIPIYESSSSLQFIRTPHHWRIVFFFFSFNGLIILIRSRKFSVWPWALLAFVHYLTRTLFCVALKQTRMREQGVGGEGEEDWKLKEKKKTSHLTALTRNFCVIPVGLSKFYLNLDGGIRTRYEFFFYFSPFSIWGFKNKRLNGGGRGGGSFRASRAQGIQSIGYPRRLAIETKTVRVTDSPLPLTRYPRFRTTMKFFERNRSPGTGSNNKMIMISRMDAAFVRKRFGSPTRLSMSKW